MSDSADTSAPTWDLESVFEGGVRGAPFETALEQTQRAVAEIVNRVQALPALASDLEGYALALIELERVQQLVGGVISFANCTYSATTQDLAAREAAQQAQHLGGRLMDAMVRIDAQLDEATDEVFEAFVTRPDLGDFQPVLRVTRRTKDLRLPSGERTLATALRPHAVTGWDQLYKRTAGGLRVHVALPTDSEPQSYSMSELGGFVAHPEESVRERIHHATETAWETAQDTCALALTHITGSRSALNRHRGVDELADTCADNRVLPETLDALWSAADHLGDDLRAYLKRKASLLGKESLDWWDQSAPLALQDEAEPWTFREAAEAVVESFGSFDPAMAQFAERAISRGWVEAEPRTGKRAGGFCSRLPSVEQSRILMTWSPTLEAAFTLAHELGHAWHNEALFASPSPRRSVRSATAETASTFAEALLRDHLLRTAPASLQLRIVDKQVRSGAGFLLGVRTAYDFERSLYGMVERGPLSPGALNERMEQVQRQVYGDALASFRPSRWQSILHFYIGSKSFYNWPYTFGYLFSTAAYAQAQEEGPDFVPRYVRLLTQTGYGWTEDTAQECLGVDLTDPAFWIRATQPLQRNIATFLHATA